ncbi:MAG: hypothetical protein ABSG63_07360 [Spirochaetia bacterium]
MAFNKLAAALTDALVTLEPNKLEAHELVMILGAAIGGKPSPKAIPLLSSIDETPELCDLYGRMLHLPGTSSRVLDRSTIALWLLRSTTTKGAAATIRDLELFLGSQDIVLRQVFSIEGLNLTKEVSLDAKTYLLPWEQLPESTGKGKARLLAMDQLRPLSAALIREIVVPKKFLRPDEIVGVPPALLPSDYSDIVMCASLFGPSGAAIASVWWEAPAWIPPEGTSISYSIERAKPQNANWPDEAYDSFPRLYRCFRNLTADEQARFRVPLQRLNSAMRRWDPVDSAIDSGIAIESLFQSGSSHVFLLRAARYLDVDPVERKKTKTKLLLQNKARNRAVHDGKVPKTIDGVAIDKILSVGFDLLAKSIIRMIENGAPVWEDFDLS